MLITDPWEKSAAATLLSLAVPLLVIGCAASDHRHGRSAKGDNHIHMADGRVVYLDREAQAAATGQVATEMAKAAEKFLASLEPEKRQQALFELTDAERLNWHFIPRDRKGLSFKQMTEQQQELAHALLKTALSARGYVAATTIIDLENVLREMENAEHRDPTRYFVSIFSEPKAEGTWGWRFEGHHLSLNFTLVEGKAVATSPSFLGANPAEVRQGEKKGLRALGAEEDLGRQFVNALSDEQKKKAIISEEAPPDVLAVPGRTMQDVGEPTGLAWADMTANQQKQLLALVEHYARRLREELAENDLEEIRSAGLEKVYFAWAGSVEKGKGHYYRIHGPTFLIEYDNTQNDANHVHTVWRDADNDFGQDLLRRHYEVHEHDEEHGHDEAGK